MIPLPLTVDRIRFVLDRVRADDRREIEATMPVRPAETLPMQIARACRFGLVAAADDGEPVAVVAAAEVWPGVWQVGMFATDRWSCVAHPVTRWIRRALMPALLDAGAHRAHCYALADRPASEDWLRHLGAQDEGFLRGFGRNGEDFVIYAWSKNDVRPRFPEAENAESHAARAHAR